MMNKTEQRIALFLPTLSEGGAERVFLNLAVGLSQKGYLIDFILSQAEGPYVTELPDLPKSIRVIVLNRHNHNSSRTIISLPALIRYLRHEKPVALLSALHANIIAVWARKLAGVPTRIAINEQNTFTFQNQVLPGAYGWLMLQLIRLFYPWADRIIAVSHGAADDLSIAARIPKSRILTIFNPIITIELQMKASASFDHSWFYPNEPPVIVSIGRLTEQKDFNTLIRAFALARKEKASRLLILGEGEDRKKLEALIHELEMDQYVSMPGFVQNPYPYLTHAALYVLSSRWEGLPTALVEALYCNTPVIATDCPSGPREILKDGLYGQLVPMGDVTHLAQAILSGLNGNILRMPPDILNDYRLENILNQYVQVLLES
jgi:glycosyltransferase involved in cell wall biosynthesis